MPSTNEYANDLTDDEYDGFYQQSSSCQIALQVALRIG